MSEDSTGYMQALAKLKVWLKLSAYSEKGNAQPLPGDNIWGHGGPTQELLAQRQQEIETLRGSRAFRLGRAVTVPSRKAIDALSRAAKLGKTGAGGRGGDNQNRNLFSAFEDIFPVCKNTHSPSWLAASSGPIQGKLRLALVADEFTLSNLRMEADVELVVLHPHTAISQVEAFRPHMVLVESAWLGQDGAWQGMLVDKPAAPVRELAEHCRSARMRTAFWNKEDPLHFEAFIQAAGLFDVVLTTDADLIPRYRRELGHGRVFAWPFALQPKLFNPIRIPNQAIEEKGFFAGAWYASMPERCRDFLQLVGAFHVESGLDIYDRHGATGSLEKRYPSYLHPLIRGATPYQDMPNMMRGYRVGLNLNSIKRSSTMFARRVLELVGSNVSVYSNYSLALRRLFSGLVVATDDAIALHRELHEELSAPNAMAQRMRRLLALRTVLQAHDWHARLTALCGWLNLEWGTRPQEKSHINILMVGAGTQLDWERSRQEVRTQLGVETAVWTAACSAPRAGEDTFVISNEDAEQTPACKFGEGAWVCVWRVIDHHGPYYLNDLLQAEKFMDSEVIGKATSPCFGNDGMVVEPVPEREYVLCGSLPVRSSIFRARHWSGTIAELMDTAGIAEVGHESAISIDSLSYVQNGGGNAHSPMISGDGWLLTQCSWPPGTAMLSGSIARPGATGLFGLSGATMATLFSGTHEVSLARCRHRAELVSRIHEPVSLLSSGVELNEVPAGANGVVELHLDALPNPAWRISMQGLDQNGGVRDSVALPQGGNVSWRLGPEIVTLRLNLEVLAPTVAHIDALWFGHLEQAALPVEGRGRVLVVTNIYPSSDALYRNAFVHRRVKAYQKHGVEVDVVCVSSTAPRSNYEFDGVLVHVCDADTLAATLAVKQYKAVAAHAINDYMWAALADYAERNRVVVWLHGAEAQPWTRRAFDLAEDPELRANQIELSDQRMAFWKKLLLQPPECLYLVFVSNTFAGEFQEDTGVSLPAGRWRVIPNPIDTDLFKYRPKPVEQRYKVLSIRPHASRVYANDLVAEAIKNLSASPDFEKFSFLLVGDGPRHEQDFAGLDKYHNVQIRKQFLSQGEIAELHQEYGVFLVPTRGDTHGVSRDEAMASGLVPVTCDVGAVREFVGDDCGLVCLPEMPEALAGCLVRLADAPGMFTAMSRAAFTCAINGRGHDEVILRELKQLGCG